MKLGNLLCLKNLHSKDQGGVCIALLAALVLLCESSG